MKLTYLLWGYPYDEAIIRAFEEEGFQIERVDFRKDKDSGSILNTGWTVLKQNNELVINETLIQKFEACCGEIVFSVNFNDVISDFCQKKGIPYCTWVLDLPNFDLYTKSIFNACNYIGICDSYMVEKMWRLGVKKVFFLPDAVELGEKIKDIKEEREFCLIVKHPGEVLNTETMSLYGKGYLDSFIHAQRVLLGANILEDGLLNRVYQEFVNCNPIPSHILPQMQKLYVADKYLAPECTARQQNIFVKNHENIITIYSDEGFEMCKSLKNPYVPDEMERRKIYAGKEFSLVLAPHILHNGIPRDVLEVIAAGGFPVCSYQKDFIYFFKRNENLAYFTKIDEFKEIILRYGNHPEERERVKENAYNLVAACHTYQSRIANMLEIWANF